MTKPRDLATLGGGFTQSGTGAIQRTVENKLKDTVSVKDFGAVGDGVADDTAAFVAALSAASVVYGKAGDTYLINSTVTVANNKTLQGNGATIKSASSITTFQFSGNNSKFSDWNVLANGALYFLRNSGSNNICKNNTFTGSVGHYIFSDPSSQHTVVQNNFVNGEELSRIVTSFVFESSQDIHVSGNSFLNVENWCVQVRGASNQVLIANNNCYATQYTSTVTATAGQTVFNFTLSKPCHLAGIQLNGAPYSTGLTFSPTVPVEPPTTTWQVTFASGRTAGDVVKLIAFRAAENIQINGSTTDFTITGNSLNGSGDSGIVVASTAKRGTISNNTIQNISYAGISLEGGIQQIAITGNSITNASLITQAATYSSGILVGGPDNLIVGNTINNVFGAPTMLYGVSINYYATEDGAFDESIKIGQNNYCGLFTKKLFIPNQDAAQKRVSISLMDGASTNYPERINLDSAFTNAPAATNYWTYSGFGGTYSIRDTTIKQGGAASLKTVAGEYINMQPTAGNALMDCIVNFNFWAKNNSGSSYVTVFLDIGGSLVGSPSVTITDTTWKQYNLNFAISANIIASNLSIRVGSNTGFANFQHFEMSMTKI